MANWAQVAALVVGGVMNAQQAKEDVKAENDAISYNMRIMRKNADHKKLQAENARLRGKIEAKRHRQGITLLVGAQRNSMASTGAVVDEGSFRDIIDETVSFGELDALAIEKNAAQEATGFENQAWNYEAQEQLFKSTKRSEDDAVWMSLTNSGSSAASMFGGGGGGGGGGGSKHRFYDAGGSDNSFNGRYYA